MKRPVYLDNAATTPVDPRVAAAMAQCLTADGEFGNPASASHDYGDAASALVEAARAQVASSVGASPREVIWTSGATEADNLAIFGVARYYRDSGRHIVTARTEHKAVLDPCRELERRGWRVTYLVPDRGGIIDPEQVAGLAGHTLHDQSRLGGTRSFVTTNYGIIYGRVGSKRSRMASRSR